MNRFAYSLTFSLLCCTVAISPAQAQQVIAENTQTQAETLEQIAEDQDLPIALLENNQAFVQEELIEPQVVSQPEPMAIITNEPVQQQETPTEIPLQTPDTNIISDTPQAEVISSETIVSEEVVVITPEVREIPIENASSSVQAYPVPQADAPYAAPAVEPESIVADNTVSQEAAPQPEVIQESPAEPVNDIPVQEEMQKTEPEVQTVTETEVAEEESVQAPAPEPESEPEPAPEEVPQPAPTHFRSSAFSLNEKAPIPSKLFGDNGFAPSIMDKRISISPEQRAQMMMKKKYDEMDFNRDGVVSENEFIHYKTEEAKKISREIFAHVDINKDGVISESEYEVLMKKMIDSFMKQPSITPGAMNSPANSGIL